MTAVARPAPLKQVRGIVPEALLGSTTQQTTQETTQDGLGEKLGERLGETQVTEPVTGEAAGEVTGEVTGVVAPQVTPQVASSATGEVAGEVTRLLPVCRGAMARAAMRETRFSDVAEVAKTSGRWPIAQQIARILANSATRHVKLTLGGTTQRGLGEAPVAKTGAAFLSSLWEGRTEA